MEFAKYPDCAQAFLSRAHNHLRRFDETNDGSGVLYGGLELRFGIEARLYKYLTATLKKLGRKGPSGHEAKKLLAHLQRIAPDSHRPVELRITNEQTGKGLPTMVYTPVTPELARDHGKIGALLHYQFFHAHRNSWMVPMRSKQGRHTLLDWREYLGKVAGRLEEACRGALLTHPTFTVLVEEIASKEDQERT